MGIPPTDNQVVSIQDVYDDDDDVLYIFFLAGKAILPDALIIQLWG